MPQSLARIPGFRGAAGSKTALVLAVGLGLAGGTGGCESGFSRIDRQVQRLLDESSDRLGPDAPAPGINESGAPHAEMGGTSDPTERHPATVNPAATDLTVKAISEADDVLARLRSYGAESADAMQLDLTGALACAAENSREYRFAEEEYILSALRLLIERHRWGPLFFDEASAIANAQGTGGLYDSSIRLVNEFRVTQNLPYGGEVSARALATAVYDLNQRVAGENVQNAAMIIAADIPLLRGAGLVAQESRIQAERNVVYAARDFEQFRRDFLFDIARDFLNLVLSQQSVANADRQVIRLREVERRERSLYESGRTPLFQAALAEQSTVSALDTLNIRREQFRLGLDQFKIRIGIPMATEVAIVPSGLELPIPDVSMDDSVRSAMLYRLDVQTQRDRVDDARRALDNAKNAMLPDLNLNAAATITTDPSKEIGGVDFSLEDNRFVGGITFGLPLDREVERLNTRQSQIQLERSRREFDRLRDETAVSVRAAVRDIDRARYTVQIQERSVAIGEQRKASIEAAPDRATARDASDAANELLRAQDRRDSARRDLQVAILRYLVQTGQLRVSPQGQVLPLRGMRDTPPMDLATQPVAPAGGATQPASTQPSTQPSLP